MGDVIICFSVDIIVSVDSTISPFDGLKENWLGTVNY